MLRVFIVIGMLSLFATTSCLQDHEPSFLTEEVENLLTGLDTAIWQMDVLIENGNRITLSECEQATHLYLIKNNSAFQLIDVAPFCSGNGGELNSGTWEVSGNVDSNIRRLTLTYSESTSYTFLIENISPFSFRLSRSTQSGESTSQEIREYVRVRIEGDEE